MRRAILLVSLLLALLAPRLACAQVSIGTADNQSDPNVVCVADPEGSTDLRYSSGVTANAPGAKDRWEYYVKKLADEQGRRIYPDCTMYQLIDDHYLQSLNVNSTYKSISGRMIHTERLPGLPNDWATREIPAPVSDTQSPIKEITYAFQNVSDRRTRQGYRNATIKLRYRFLLCADEVQIAYSLDPKSLDYDPKYYDYSRSGPHNVGTVEAPGAPDMPSSIAIALHITRWPDTSIIATIKDAIAGESLGMGCFTGQTQRVGMLAKLLGPKPTRADVRKYLGELSAAAAFNSLAILDVPLRNSHVTLPDDALPESGSASRDAAAARARADAAENSSTAKLNADNAATAAAAGRKYVADQEAAARAQADYEKQKAAKAKYDADMAAYRKRVADDAAEAARKKAAFDARNELYKACIAGDHAACKRYEAGQ